MNSKQFIRTIDVNIEDINKDNISVLLKTVVFFEAEKETKRAELEKAADIVFGKRITSKEIINTDNFDLIIKQDGFSEF